MQQLLEVNSNEQQRMDDMDIECSDCIKEKGSTIQAYAVKTTSWEDVRRAYKRVRLVHPLADHVVSAYVTKFNRGGNDDGEIGAPLKLQTKVSGRQKR